MGIIDGGDESRPFRQNWAGTLFFLFIAFIIGIRIPYSKIHPRETLAIFAMGFFVSLQIWRSLLDRGGLGGRYLVERLAVMLLLLLIFCSFALGAVLNSWKLLVVSEVLSLISVLWMTTLFFRFEDPLRLHH